MDAALGFTAWPQPSCTPFVFSFACAAGVAAGVGVAVGVGVGGSLVNKKWVESGEYARITQEAKRFVAAVAE